MRLLGSIVVILIIIIYAGFRLNYELQASTNDLIHQIDQVSILIRENNWQTAIEQTEKLNEVWEKEAKWWPVFLEHQEMDNIEFSMAKFKEYVANKNDSLSLGQLSEIRLMIEHIPRKEVINIKNIL
jgi:hypothetical protein